jgi:hypothetical protein
MRSWKIWARKFIFHVAGRALVAGVYTPSAGLETQGNVPFAIPTEVAKQMMKELKN